MDREAGEVSALAVHALAARFLAESFERQAGSGSRDAAGLVMAGMAAAYHDAADAMEAAIRDDLADHPAGCTIDHRSLGVAKCPACGAPRVK